MRDLDGFAFEVFVGLGPNNLFDLDAAILVRLAVDVRDHVPVGDQKLRPRQDNLRRPHRRGRQVGQPAQPAEKEHRRNDQAQPCRLQRVHSTSSNSMRKSWTSSRSRSNTSRKSSRQSRSVLLIKFSWTRLKTISPKSAVLRIPHMRNTIRAMKPNSRRARSRIPATSSRPVT